VGVLALDVMGITTLVDAFWQVSTILHENQLTALCIARDKA
jgi:hypothetical protein